MVVSLRRAARRSGPVGRILPQQLPSAVEIRRHHQPSETAAVTADRQTLSELTYKAVQVLTQLGADPEQVRREIMRLLAEVQRKPAPPQRDELVSISGDKMAAC